MEKLRAAWTRLVAQSQAATPFQTWEWCEGVSRWKGDRVKLRVVVGENEEGGVVGIAPLWIRREGYPPLAVLEFIGTGQADYVDFLCVESYREAFVRCVMAWTEQNREWGVLNFQPACQSLVSLLTHCGEYATRLCGVSPYAILPGTIEEYEAQVLQKRLRKSIKRNRRLLAGDGRLVVSLAQDAAQVRADLSVLFDLHQRRQRAKGERGRFFDRHWRDCFEDLSVKMLEAGWLKLGTLRIDGQPAASVYNLRMGGREYLISSGMEPAFSRWSPTSLLDHSMISCAIKEGVRVYDFLIGSEPYKSRWTNASCQVFEIMRARTRAAGLVWRNWQAIRKVVRRNRALKRLYLATVGRLEALPRTSQVPNGGLGSQ
jgi:CelD/BcsL family acetyltransferase involved in cellulose biosynthesis